ncbi:MAG TPA: hypothetical protein VE619_02140 [Nitrososphaeraceae archaeon]|nr:hypothetical protein [Nitrososphaeraceae archaeon]
MASTNKDILVLDDDSDIVSFITSNMDITSKDEVESIWVYRSFFSFRLQLRG